MNAAQRRVLADAIASAEDNLYRAQAEFAGKPLFGPTHSKSYKTRAQVLEELQSHVNELKEPTSP